jgi:hypothetical protein
MRPEVDGLRSRANLRAFAGLSPDDRVALEHWLVGTAR